MTQDTDAFEHLGSRILRARQRLRLSQQELAEQAGISKNWIGQIERGIVTNPGIDTIRRLEKVLKSPLLGNESTVTFPSEGFVTPSGPGLEGVVLLPVYRWGSKGDPRDPYTRPYPEYKEHPATRQTLVGPRGFGIIARSDELGNIGIYEGEVLWVNPDDPPRLGKLVAFYDEQDGLVVRLLNSHGHAQVIGPVVWVSSGHPPP